LHWIRDMHVPAFWQSLGPLYFFVGGDVNVSRKQTDVVEIDVEEHHLSKSARSSSSMLAPSSSSSSVAPDKLPKTSAISSLEILRP